MRTVMAPSNLASNLFEPNQVSSLILADNSLQFLQEHGFFYQEDSSIGRLVDELYSQDRARSDDVRLAYFQPTLQQDPVCRNEDVLWLMLIIYSV